MRVRGAGDDESSAAALPILGNQIALGNRSISRTIEHLYNLYYCLLDLKYPGPEGYVVRTLHSPFGDGKNVIFAGGKVRLLIQLLHWHHEHLSPYELA